MIGMSNLVLTLLQRSSNAAAQIRVNSALNPILWLCVFVSPLCFYLASSTPREKLVILFMIIGCCPILIACIGFLYLLFRKPDYLRSEKFHLQKLSTEILGSKGHELSTDIDHAIAASRLDSSEIKDKKV